MIFMNDNVKIIEDAISLENQECLLNMVMEPYFPWFYNPFTITEDDGFNKHQFTHFIYKPEMQKEPHCWLDKVMGCFSFPEFETHMLNRAQFNLNTPYKVTYIDQLIHTDSSNPESVTYLYYVNDSDGPTTLYDSNEEKIIIHPKQGKMVRFPSNTRHSANVPFNYETRIVLNMVFDPLLS